MFFLFQLFFSSSHPTKKVFTIFDNSVNFLGLGYKVRNAIFWTQFEVTKLIIIFKPMFYSKVQWSVLNTLKIIFSVT